MVNILLADGFEEAEALTIVDILRRADLPVESIGVTGSEITGGHGIALRTDKVLTEISAEQLEMLVLPGGYPGASCLQHSQEVRSLIKAMNSQGKWLAAICAAPQVLKHAGVLEGKHYTAYSEAPSKDIVVRDGNLITGRGPAAVYAFAYALVDALGGDSLAVKNRMLYFHAFKEEKAHV